MVCNSRQITLIFRQCLCLHEWRYLFLLSNNPILLTLSTLATEDVSTDNSQNLLVDVQHMSKNCIMQISLHDIFCKRRRKEGLALYTEMKFHLWLSHKLPAFDRQLFSFCFLLSYHASNITSHFWVNLGGHIHSCLSNMSGDIFTTEIFRIPRASCQGDNNHSYILKILNFPTSLQTPFFLSDEHWKFPVNLKKIQP